MKDHISDLTVTEPGGELYPLQNPPEAKKSAALAGTQPTATVRFQRQFSLAFAGIGKVAPQLVYAPAYGQNYFHITKIHWAVYQAAAKNIDFYFGSAAVITAAVPPITPTIYKLQDGDFDEHDYNELPLNALNPGDSLWVCPDLDVAPGGACTITGMIVGWEDAEKWPSRSQMRRT